MPQKPDYGIDAPGVVRNLLVIGVALIISGIIFPTIHLGNVTILWSRSAIWPGASCLVGGLLMLIYAKWGKFRHRDTMLNMLNWRGDERVLDVGTGRACCSSAQLGGSQPAPQQASTFGAPRASSGNSLSRTQTNIEVEGVQDKVAAQKSDDARKLNFPDASFDVILSNLCLHNIPQVEGRAQACREIARVLKPGGTALISDLANTGTYQKTLAACGLKASRTGFTLLTFPWLRVVRAEKP